MSSRAPSRTIIRPTTARTAAKECGYDALIASLTFLAVAGRRVQLEIFNQFDVPINMERVLHRDQKLIFHRPILAGDKLFFDSYLDSVTESHGAVLTEIRGEVTDADGKPGDHQHRHRARRGRHRRRGRRGQRADRRRARCGDRQNDCWANFLGELGPASTYRYGERKAQPRNVFRRLASS